MGAAGVLRKPLAAMPESKCPTQTFAFSLHPPTDEWARHAGGRFALGSPVLESTPKGIAVARSTRSVGSDGVNLFRYLEQIMISETIY
jgi:hypothetical protein